MRHLSNPFLWTLLFLLWPERETSPAAAVMWERASREHLRRVADLRGGWKRGEVTGPGMKRLARYFDAKHAHDDQLREEQVQELEQLQAEHEALLARLADLLTETGIAPEVEA